MPNETLQKQNIDEQIDAVQMACLRFPVRNLICMGFASQYSRYTRFSVTSSSLSDLTQKMWFEVHANN